MADNKVIMRYPGNRGSAEVTRKAFDEVWSDKGWVIADEGVPEPGAPEPEAVEPEGPELSDNNNPIKPSEEDTAHEPVHEEGEDQDLLRSVHRGSRRSQRH